MLPDEDIQQMCRSWIARAKAGDVRFAEMIYARIAGKPVERQEQGEPGAFDPIGAALNEYSVDELRGMLHVSRAQAAEDGLITASPGGLLAPKI